MSDILNLKYSELLKKNDNYYDYLDSFSKSDINLNLKNFLKWINQYKNIDSIEDLINMEELHFGYYQEIKSLPSSIGYLKNLKKIDLCSKNLKKIPSSIGNLEKLEILYLDNNKELELANALGKLTNLKELHLKGISYDEIPNFIWNLTKLEELYIGSSKLKEIPNGISKLKNLRVLEISGKNLEYISNEIGNLSNLRVLQINNITKINKIPRFIFDFKQELFILFHNNNNFNLLEKVKLMKIRMNNIKFMKRVLFSYKKIWKEEKNLNFTAESYLEFLRNLDYDNPDYKNKLFKDVFKK